MRWRRNGARFSEQGYATLVESAGRDEGLAEKLGLRLDIPVNLLRDLLAKATAAVRDRLLKAAPQEMRAEDPGRRAVDRRRGQGPEAGRLYRRKTPCWR